MAGVQPAAAAVLLPGEGDRGGGGGRHQPHHRPDLPQRHPPARARPCLDDRLQVLYLMYTSRSRYVIRQRRHHLHQCRCDSLQSCGPGGALSGAVQMLFVCGIDALMNKYNFRTVQFF